MKILFLFGLQRLCPKCKGVMKRFPTMYHCQRCGHSVDRIRR